MCKTLGLRDQAGIAALIKTYTIVARQYAGAKLLDNDKPISTEDMADMAAEYLLSFSDLIQGCDDVVQKRAQYNGQLPDLDPSDALDPADA